MVSETKSGTELRESADLKLLQTSRGAAADVESGVRVRPMNDADLELVRELRSKVSWSGDPRAFDLLRGMRDARWTVAEAPDGTLAGMVGAVPLGDIGILCHLAVRGGYRRSGIGARLTAWAVAYLRSRGASLIRLYSTRQAEKIYRAAGFKPTAPRTVYRLGEKFRELRAQQGACLIEPLSQSGLPEVYGVDRWSYGADRSALILAALSLHSGQGLVARDRGGGIKGYLVRSATPDAVHVGPFIAETPGVARLLITRCLNSCDTPVEVTITGPKYAPAHRLFEELGFEGREDRLRMELGKTLSPRRKGLEHYGTTPFLAT